MKLRIDREANALSLTLDDSAAVESEKVLPGIIVDDDADNNVLGIEMLYLSRRTPKLDPDRFLFEMVSKPAPRPSDSLSIEQP